MNTGSLQTTSVHTDTHCNGLCTYIRVFGNGTKRSCLMGKQPQYDLVFTYFQRDFLSLSAYQQFLSDFKNLTSNVAKYAKE